MATGFVFHERYLWHNTGRHAGPFGADASGYLEPDVRHAENADGKRRIKSLLEVTGLLDQLTRIDPRSATADEVAQVHTREYIDRIKAESDHWGGDGGDGATPFGKGSYEVALLSAGGVLAAVDAVLDGTVANAFALVRPPGHHALPDMGMGFCLFGNAAIAAKHAQTRDGIERVAIVDWDVHHGNGTQAAFYDDPSVLTISLHQDNVFPPDSGHVEDTGEGAGEGYNLNVPLPPGTGNGGYQHAFDELVVPALDAFAPDLIILASGLDASAMDPLGRMMLTPAGYGTLTRTMLDAAARLCDGRLVVEHEGGYSPELVPFCALAIVEELSGIVTDCKDTILQAFPEGFAGHALQPHQAEAVARAAANLDLMRATSSQEALG
jgi:acetoin utilization deacetylase AcuC-like enzyme